MGVGNQGPDGDVHLEVFARSAGTLRTLAVAAAIRPKEIPVSEGEQGVEFGIGDQNDRASVPPVPSVGSASWDELLPSERDTPVPTIAAPNGNASFVDEHG